MSDDYKCGLSLRFKYTTKLVIYFYHNIKGDINRSKFNTHNIEL